MDFTHFITSTTGLIHFITAMSAVVLGTLVLALEKGTKRHTFIGKLYGLSMILTLATAFMIYRLFGKWGMFHYSALVSTITLLCGIVPIYLRKPQKSYLSLHFSFMYWSVMGVYAALCAEILVRIPSVITNSGIANNIFYNMVGVATALVMGIGAFFFIQLKPKWNKTFDSQNI